MMVTLLKRRSDGSFVAQVNGLPYHVAEGDPLFAEAQRAAAKMGAKLPLDVAPETSPPTIDAYEATIQDHVDAAARSKQFRDGVTMASYVSSTNPQWAEEAMAFIAWRDAVWAYAYAELAKVQNGERAQPSMDEFISELPKIIWP